MASKTIRHDAEVLRAFAAQVKEIDEAAEFERLMLGKEASIDESFKVIDDSNDRFWISVYLWDGHENSAVDDLRFERALERLISRYPSVWDAVQVAA